MAQKKEVKLRAFRISQQLPITHAQIALVDALNTKLINSKAKTRMMQRNANDKEYDLISYYNFDNGTFFGVNLRVITDFTSPQIDYILLESQNFSLEQLEDGHAPNTVYKSHYYFCLNNTYIVTNLPGNSTIIGFQTYLNWLLYTATNPYEINPLCKSTPDIKLSEIKEVIFEDDYAFSSYRRSPHDLEQTENKIFDIAYGALRTIFNDITGLQEEEMKQVISAKLLLSIKKPRNMTEDDYQRIYGALLKPIAETEHLQYVSKSGQRFSSEEIEVSSKVNIETTEKGFLVEEQLRQSMIVFLNNLTI